MWPKLVASRILRLSSHNFVADFPSMSLDSSLEHPYLDLESTDPETSVFTEHKETHKIFVSTWNVGGVAPAQDLDMEDLLDTCNNPCDIYVIGFQEVVPLRTANVLGLDNKKVCKKWNSLIRKALNKKTCCSQEAKHAAEFRCLMSKQMVGIFISVWIRGDLHPYVRNLNLSCVGCGIMGCLGNKGSVSVRFRLHETSFCFVCSHLASGGRVGDEKLRNSNVTDIFSRTSFPRGPTPKMPGKIIDHARVILLGDLNYRISLSDIETRSLVGENEWDLLMVNDQLKKELMDDQALEGWHEGAINFAPTYKYYPDSESYYGTDPGKKGEKKRAPAWCDRILWYGEGLKQHLYTRSESKLSDHRPVKAIFSCEVSVVQTVGGYRSFFLSERFENKIASSRSLEKSNTRQSI
ncbi:hypothetical protein DCAR_0727009 [Daucus carota subsp. sativus]|uniref:Inositol polyphosphate-related phosphatase domain-containing protein n=2 Tax=Daucus carota subsp. sativus TaxID=79200 RepID=A0AAF0XI99_DAUCS|nr:PREDICTED: type IV inositol polyphosphate 5-phosphatase 9-like isoform X1 [Daucus carota subsp. sativus]WOH07577.1 hypothetical protein DCAR_0727009 [Daucus carota subsp. sativus]